MKNKEWMGFFGLGLCIVGTAAMLNLGQPEVKAASLAKGSGLAGISLFMDKIYGQNENKFTRLSSNQPMYETLRAVLKDKNKVVAFSDNLENIQPVSLPTTNGTENKTEVKEEKAQDGEKETLKSRDQFDSTVAEVKSKFENIGISVASPYVNIRKEPNTESEIVAKLYEGSKCDIIKEVGDWVKIKSGNADGYIKTEYLARGFDAEKLVDKHGTKFAEVNTETLNVRFDPSTDSRIATLVPMGEKLLVLKTEGDWHEVSISNDDETGQDITGWVFHEFVDIKIRWKLAVTVEEEREEARRKAEAEAALRRQQAAWSNRTNRVARKGAKKAVVVGDNGNYSATGSNIANFALNFVGNPYVWGGTSLTNGADCSGFVKSVYSNFGIGLNRTSRAQASNGSAVSLSALQPGDLVFYAPSGRINHVAMYIGGGKIVHASSPRTGIIVSSVSYSTPYCARRIVD